MGLSDGLKRLRDKLAHAIEEVVGDQPDSASAPGLTEPRMPFSQAAEAAAGFPRELRSTDPDERR
jgi:hypothetical protein